MTFQKADKLEFRYIVLAHIKTILDLSSHELRDATRQVIHSNHTETIESEDTRYAYIQSVENLSYVLCAYFDDKILDIYKECIKVMNSLSYKILEDFKEEYDEVKDKLKQEEIDLWFPLTIKMRYAKKLFYELNLLLKREEYLKGEVYGQSVTDEVIDEEEVED